MDSLVSARHVGTIYNNWYLNGTELTPNQGYAYKVYNAKGFDLSIEGLMQLCLSMALRAKATNPIETGQKLYEIYADVIRLAISYGFIFEFELQSAIESGRGISYHSVWNKATNSRVYLIKHFAMDVELTTIIESIGDALIGQQPDGKQYLPTYDPKKDEYGTIAINDLLMTSYEYQLFQIKNNKI